MESGSPSRPECSKALHHQKPLESHGISDDSPLRRTAPKDPTSAETAEKAQETGSQEVHEGEAQETRRKEAQQGEDTSKKRYAQ